VFEHFVSYLVYFKKLCFLRFIEKIGHKWESSHLYSKNVCNVYLCCIMYKYTSTNTQFFGYKYTILNFCVCKFFFNFKTKIISVKSILMVFKLSFKKKNHCLIPTLLKLSEIFLEALRIFTIFRYLAKNDQMTKVNTIYIKYTIL
jgi:hypothetical protein